MILRFVSKYLSLQNANNYNNFFSCIFKIPDIQTNEINPAKDVVSSKKHSYVGHQEILKSQNFTELDKHSSIYPLIKML